MQSHYDCKRGQLRVQRNMCKTKGSELISLSKIRPKKHIPLIRKNERVCLKYSRIMFLIEIEHLAKKKECQNVLEREVLNEKNTGRVCLKAGV